jgi:hypothetical protein
VAGGEREEMEMRIDEAREHDRATTVDALDVPPGERPEHGAVTDRENAAGTDGDRTRGGRVPIEGHHPRPIEEPVRGAQSEDGSGFASLTFISWLQHVTLPLPALLQRISVPQVSQR